MSTKRPGGEVDGAKAKRPAVASSGVPAPLVSAGDYDVVVGVGFLDAVPADIVRLVNAPSYLVISDTNIFDLHGMAVVTGLIEASAAERGTAAIVKHYVVAPGEQSKCRATKADIEDFMTDNGFDRGSVIVALGGGVVGDLSGFVAATYMRGIKFVQIPTTLLAMVDSSIGGKTGIDIPAGKNLIGAFHNPKRVYADISLLRTLNDRELRAGLAEVIKAGAIYSAPLFRELEDSADKIIGRDENALASVIGQSIRIKAEVVIEDHKEKGLREILNYGHSIGHAIEAIMTPELLHGECVAIGMVKETELARGFGELSPDALGRMQSILLAYKLPVDVPAKSEPALVLEKMAVDKKNAGGVKRVVLLKAIGDAGRAATGVTDKAIMKCLAPGACVVPRGPLKGTIRVPGSKSISNRVLLMAALGRGRCEISGLLHSHDTLVMMNALQALGLAEFEWLDNGNVVGVTGADGKLVHSSDDEVYLGNAGTASRFLATACTMVTGTPTVITGNARMKERPIGPLVDALRSVGCAIDYLETEGCLPLRIRGGGFPGGEVLLSASVSSQYVSSILISSVYAKTPTTLRLTDVAVSKPYIDMTLAIMKQFGVEVENPEEGVYIIPNAGYTNPPTFMVEADASSASYPLAMAAISGGSVTVDGIGSASLQGDADFCRVLEQMGCKVEQTEMSTTVTGPPPGQLTAIDVDMSNVTDTFMTAAAVMATVPGGTSKIYNIANQRVKECDRIAATVAELTKCGVVARELPDGVEVDGQASIPDALSGGSAEIHCYKDHRIAMSFAVLGTVWKNINIMDKGCTDKTFPSFWDDINFVFGLNVEPWLPEQASQSAEASEGSGPAELSGVVIIGMRGAGKTTFGRRAAHTLGYKFADLDTVIEEMVGPIPKYVEENGWPAFRARETEALRAQLALLASGERLVLSCGGGVVEAAENRSILAAYQGPIVWLQRPIETIEAYLTGDGSRPTLGEPIREIYARREPYFADLSTHEFLPPQGDDFQSALADFGKFCIGVSGCGRPLLRDSVTVAPIALKSIEDVSRLTVSKYGVDLVEIRADRFVNITTPVAVHELIRQVRRRTTHPLLFTLRTTQSSTDGCFNGSREQFWSILKTAVRAGCEFVDIEHCGHASELDKFLRDELRGTLCQSVVTYTRSLPYGNIDEFRADYVQCCRPGVTFVRLIVNLCTSTDIALTQAAIAALEKSGDLTVPVTVVHLGAALPLSCVTNGSMTPVCASTSRHPFDLAPLTSDTLWSRRLELGLVPQKEFYLFGTPISKSPSPFMHSVNFGLLGYPHRYTLHDTPDVESVIAKLRAPGAGGGSVTIPHKRSVMPYLSQMSPSAEVIGAVNTIFVQEDGRLLGDNTDWIGIRNALLKSRDQWKGANALIVGAGGTSRAVAYALRQMGFETINIYNRTFERAAEIAELFSCTPVTSLEAVDSNALDLIVSTIPGSSEFTVPTDVLANKPVVFDVSYIPKWTRVLTQARSAGCQTIDGLEMLIQQGIEQARLWCHCEVPATEIADAVRRQYDPEYVATAELSSAVSAVVDSWVSSTAALREYQDTAEAQRAVRAQLSGKSNSAPKEDILEVITRQRRADVAQAQLVLPLEELKARLATSRRPPPVRFINRLQQSFPCAVIGEVKRASPSKGDIALDIVAPDQAVRYARGGAAAISVLTEPTWFKGTLEDMRAAADAVAKLPNRPAILRKDFLIDPYQIFEARLYGADAVLLIVAILKDAELTSLLKLTRSLGMEALVEVVTAEELSRALAAGASVIGVNNRNLRNFTVDTTKTGRVLSEAGLIGPGSKASGKVLLALSGIQSRVDVQGYRASGVHGVLVGEALMRAPDPRAMISGLRGASETSTLVKICGLTTTEAAASTAMAGADMIGLVFAEGSKRCVSVALGQAIVAHVKSQFPVEGDFVSRALAAPWTAPTDKTDAKEWYASWVSKLRRATAARPLFFGVFANQPVDEVNRIAEEVGLDVIQLSGKEGFSGLEEYCRPVVKAVHIGDGDLAQDVAATTRLGRPIAVLLDTKSPTMMGGTGEAFDWGLAADLGSKEATPSFLAGGLKPDTIADAVQQVRPFAVDVSSGVEAAPGVKDPEKVSAFIRAAKAVPI